MNHAVENVPGGIQGIYEPAPVVGGSPSMIKKTDKKVKVLSRERCIYVDCKRREYIKLKGKYVWLTDARKM